MKNMSRKVKICFGWLGLLVVSSVGFAADWQLFLQNVPLPDQDFLHDYVSFTTNDMTVKVDYVTVSTPASGIVFQDDFNGPAGSPPDPNKWVYQGSDPTRAQLDGVGHLVLRKGAGWSDLLSTADAVTTWVMEDEPTLEMGLIFCADAWPNEASFGFASNSGAMYAGYPMFYAQADRALRILYNAFIQPPIGPTIPNVAWFGDCATLQYFRIVKHADGTADYWGKDIGPPPCTPPAGDLTGDCKVDLKDLAFLAAHWLEDTNIK